MPTIDGLVDGTTPLAGTERVPIWQSADAHDVPATAISDLAGWRKLGSSTLGADAASISLTPLTAMDLLLIEIVLVGFAVADRPALRFNNDSGTNYNNRQLQSAAAATIFTNIEEVSQTRMALGSTNATGARVFTLRVPNRTTLAKFCSIVLAQPTGSAAAAPSLNITGGGWYNTSAQITRVDLIGVAGNNLLAGTSLTVLGMNP